MGGVRRRAWQSRNRSRLLDLVHVRVNIECQTDVAVSSQRLSEFRRNATLAKVGYECVPIGMKVSKNVLVAFIRQKIRCLPFGSLAQIARIVDPTLISPPNLSRFVVLSFKHGGESTIESLESACIISEPFGDGNDFQLDEFDELGLYQNADPVDRVE